MAFTVVRVIPDEELPHSPLRSEEPISRALGAIPGVGGFLKGVQQHTSPSGVMGPGVIAQIMAGLQQKATGTGSPQDFYEKTIGPTESIAGTAASLAMPARTFLQRLLTGAVMPMVEHALQGGSGETGFLKGLGGAAIQTGLEGILKIPKQIGLHRLAKSARTQYDTATEAHNAQNAEDLAGDRMQGALDLRAHRTETAAVKAQNARQKAATDSVNEAAQSAHATRVQSIRGADAQRIRAEKQAYQSSKRATLAGHDAQVSAATTAYEQSRGVHADQAAQIIMDDAKSVVPEWAAFPSNLDGIVNGVLGSGQKLSSATYGEALNLAKESARGTDVILPLTDIRKLGVPMKGLASTVDDAAAMPTHGVVDAANAIEYLNRMRGLKRDWGVYNRTTSELSKLDLGVSEEARTAYKKAQEVIEAVDTSGALRAEGGRTVLDTDKLFEAMHKVKNIDIIRKRGEQDFLTSPLVQASGGTPQPPAAIPAPIIDPFMPSAKTPLPPKPTSESFTPTPLPERPTREPFTQENPPLSPDETGAIEGRSLGTRGQRMSVGGGLGFLSGLATGQGASYYHSPTTVAGLLAGAATPNQWITKAPGMAPLEALLGELAQLSGATVREGLLPKDVTPADLAEIRAAQAAPPDPSRSLQMTLAEKIDPSETR